MGRELGDLDRNLDIGIAGGVQELPREAGIYGGEGEIRTPGSLSATSAFEAGAFNHSATSPLWGPF